MKERRCTGCGGPIVPDGSMYRCEYCKMAYEPEVQTSTSSSSSTTSSSTTMSSTSYTTRSSTMSTRSSTMSTRMPESHYYAAGLLPWPPRKSPYNDVPTSPHSFCPDSREDAILKGAVGCIAFFCGILLVMLLATALHGVLP